MVTPPSSNLRRAVSGALVQRGFVRAGRTHLIPLADDIQLVVDTGPIRPRSDISPWVGLRHDGVTNTVVSLLELERDPHVATVGANVGYVLDGNYRSWSGNEDPADVLDRIEGARKVLTKYAALDRLADAYSIRGTNGPGFCYSLVVIHAMSSDWDQASRWLDEAESIDCKFDDELCEQFQRFRRNAQARFAPNLA